MHSKVNALGIGGQLSSAALMEYEPFPVEALPAVPRRFVAGAAAAIGCDPSYVALPLLAGLAAAIGTTRLVRLKHGWTEPPVLWTVLIGESGTLKSPALEAPLRPLRKRQSDAFKRHDEEQESYRQEEERYAADLQHWRRSGHKNGDPAPTPPAPPVCERLLCGDTTIEALADRLAENRRGLLIVRDELAGWLGSFDQYKAGKGSDVAHWLTLWNAGDLLVDRKTGDKKTLYVPRAAVSVTGGVQPETLRLALGREHFADGLAARLLLAAPPRTASRWSEAEISPDLERELADLYARLWELEQVADFDGERHPGVVTLDSAAKEAWVQFHDEHAQEQLGLTGDLAAAWSKLKGYAARLALVLHLTRWAGGEPVKPDQIDRDSIASAIKLVRWFGNETRRVYGLLRESDQEREQRQRVELIRRVGGSVSERDWQRKRSLKKVEDARAELEQLRQRGLGDWQPVGPTPQGGRPTRTFVLSCGNVPDTTPLSQAENEVLSVVSPVEETAEQEPEEMYEWSSEPFLNAPVPLG